MKVEYGTNVEENKMSKYKACKIVQILDTENNHRMYEDMPRVYPKPYTMSIVKNMNTIRVAHLDNCVKYISHKELQIMIRHYNLYKKSPFTSVCDFYGKASIAKKAIEKEVKDKMQQCNGSDYKVLWGNTHYFAAAFMMPGKLLYLKTAAHNYIIDVEFIEDYLENTKEGKG